MPTITRENAASFRRPLTRDTPALPNRSMKTYGITAPLDTHWREVGCAEYGCSAHRNGWKTLVDESTDLGQRQAGYIRFRSGRAFTEHREGGITVFVFKPEQRCFTTHQTRRSRPPLFIVHGGDWRGVIGRPNVYDRPDQWVDDFATHQDRLAQKLGASR